MTHERLRDAYLEMTGHRVTCLDPDCYACRSVFADTTLELHIKLAQILVATLDGCDCDNARIHCQICVCGAAHPAGDMCS
jgi:hypothetical protein